MKINGRKAQESMLLWMIIALVLLALGIYFAYTYLKPSLFSSLGAFFGG